MPKIKTFIRGEIPSELMQAWFQHLRDFDTAHPGCHFEVMMDMPDTPLAELAQQLRIDPQLTFEAIFDRGPP